MIKDNLNFIVFFLVIGIPHYFLLPHLPAIHHQIDFWLIYICLVLIAFSGNLLFYFQQKLKFFSFITAFVAFTTFQFLAAASFVLVLKLIREDQAWSPAMHFMTVFFCVLIFQSIYFVKKQSDQPPIV